VAAGSVSPVSGLWRSQNHSIRGKKKRVNHTRRVLQKIKTAKKCIISADLQWLLS